MSFDSIEYQTVRYFETNIKYSVVFDDDGVVDTELTERLKYSALFEYICYGLLDVKGYEALWHERHEAVLEFLDSMDHKNGVTFKEVEYIADRLREFGILNSRKFDAYLELKQLFCSVGLDGNVERPLIFVSCLSRSDRFGRANDKLISKKFLKMLRALKVELSQEEFKKAVCSYECLIASAQRFFYGGKNV